MKRGLKRVFSLGIAAAMTVALFSGCGKNSDVDLGVMTKEEIAKFEETTGGLKLPLDNKATTITVLCDTSQDSNQSVVINELRRRTGINVELIQIPRATLTEKSRVMLASKDQMPDIFQGGMTVQELNEYGLQGAFEPVNEHLNELPNIKSIYVDRAQELKTEKVMKSYVASDGNLYVVPTYDSDRDVNHGMLYRKDIFDKHNIPMWNSPEEFYQAMKKLKALYPTSTPFVSKNGEAIFWRLGQSWGGLDISRPYYDETSGTWKHSATDQNLKDMLDFLKKMYDEKLIDPEFLTCTQAAWTSKMTQPTSAFTTVDWIGRLDQFYEQTRGIVPDYDLRYANPMGPSQKVITLSRVGTGPAVKKGKNSLLALKLLDYLISENGAELMTCGIEGVTFNWNKDKTHAEYIGFEEGKSIQINDLEEKYGMCVSGLYRRFDRRSAYFNLSEKEQEAQDMMLNKEGGGFLPEDPELSFTKEEQQVFSDYNAKIEKDTLEFCSKYILSSNPSETGDTAWNTWVKHAEEIGTQKVTDVYNAAQARYDAK